MDNRMSQLCVCITTLLLFMPISLCVATCPAACTCTVSRTHRTQVDCSGKGLTEIPADVSNDVSLLDLRNNHIRKITASSVAHLQNLSNILLDDNDISDIEAFSFKGFQNLKKLSLKRNKLVVIKENAFSRMSGQLSCSKINAKCNLDISENEIDTIESNAFSWITNFSINIGKTGCAMVINPYAFFGCQHIPYITISDVPHLQLKKYWVSEMDDIRALQIQHSHIPSLDQYVFEAVSNIHYLKFQNCSLGNMSNRSFSGMKFTPSTTVPSQFFHTRTMISSPTYHIAANDVLGPEYPDDYKKKPHQGCGGVLLFSKCDLSNMATDMLRDTNLEYIDIQGSRISSIHSSAFRGLGCLKKLHLSGNIIAEGLTEGSFGSIKHVEEVLFEDNDLTAIHNYAFKDTQKIGRLSFRLKANTDLILKSRSLSGLMDVYTLQITGVNHHLNKLILQKNAFYGIVDIHNITISNVGIPELVEHSLYGMKNINTLNVAESKLNSISSRAFETFPVEIPIHTFTVSGEDTGLMCDCDNLVSASDFDSMFKHHSIMCKDLDKSSSEDDNGDDSSSYTLTKLSVELYKSKNCLSITSVSSRTNINTMLMACLITMNFYLLR